MAHQFRDEEKEDKSVLKSMLQGGLIGGGLGGAAGAGAGSTAGGVLGGVKALGPGGAAMTAGISSDLMNNFSLRDMGEAARNLLASTKKGSDSKGLWDNIHAKRERGGKPAKPGDKAYPSAKSWKKTTKESVNFGNLRAGKATQAKGKKAKPGLGGPAMKMTPGKAGPGRSKMMGPKSNNNKLSAGFGFSPAQQAVNKLMAPAPVGPQLLPASPGQPLPPDNSFFSPDKSRRAMRAETSRLRTGRIAPGHRPQSMARQMGALANPKLSPAAAERSNMRQDHHSQGSTSKSRLRNRLQNRGVSPKQGSLQLPNTYVQAKQAISVIEAELTQFDTLAAARQLRGLK